MAIFNSYFDITRGYMLHLLSCSPHSFLLRVSTIQGIAGWQPLGFPRDAIQSGVRPVSYTTLWRGWFIRLYDPTIIINYPWLSHYYILLPHTSPNHLINLLRYPLIIGLSPLSLNWIIRKLSYNHPLFTSIYHITHLFFTIFDPISPHQHCLRVEGPIVQPTQISGMLQTWQFGKWNHGSRLTSV